MIFAFDFDGTVVADDRPIDDDSPLELMPGAEEALRALRDAGHVILLWSRRANRALRLDWKLDPLWRSGAVPLDPEAWARERPLRQARYEAMLRFVEERLPGVFHAVDDGGQGKADADVFIDDRAVNFGRPGWWGARARDWDEIREIWGGPG